MGGARVRTERSRGAVGETKVREVGGGTCDWERGLVVAAGAVVRRCFVRKGGERSAL